MPHSSISSPLAHIYPPLVGNIPEETVGQQDDSSNGDVAGRATGVSSIPFARRRLMSSLSVPQKRGSAEPLDIDHSGIVRPRKTSGSTVGEKAKDAPLSMSPEQIAGEPPAVAEIMEAEENSAPIDPSSWDKRLQEMEKRQVRMEALL